MTKQEQMEAAHTYVGSLRRTHQWRKSYYYGVVFEGEKIIGHIPATRLGYIEDHPIAEGRTMAIVRGRDA